MRTEILIENVKCNGCKNTIIKEVRKNEKVIDVDVEIESGKVTLEYDGGQETLARVKSILHRKGYPEKGKNNLVSSAKSFMSCAIGRVSGPANFEIKSMDFNDN